MDWQSKKTLGNLFAADQQRRQAAQAIKDEAERTTANDVEAFGRLRDGVIEPELTQIAEFVREQGWDAQVFKDEPQRVHADQKPVLRIGIYFDRQKVSSRTPEQHAFVRFACNAGLSQVTVSESTIMPGRGGTSASGGPSFSLDQITADLVGSQVTKLLAQILKSS